MIRKLAWVGKMAAVVGLPVLAFACSDSDEETPGTTDAGGDAAVECVLRTDDSCPEGCGQMRGQLLDEENRCWNDTAVFGCLPGDTGGHTAITCYINSESGALYRTAGGYFQPEGSLYRECRAEERNEAFTTERSCSEPKVECELLDDGACSAGCFPQKGFPYDEEGECLLPEEVMSCAESPGGDDAEGCYVELETGTKYWTPQLYTSNGMSRFRSCSAEEAAKIDPSARCE